MPRILFIAAVAVLLAGCAASAPEPLACPLAALPVYDVAPSIAAECLPMYDLCTEWRKSAINLCSE